MLDGSGIVLVIQVSKAVERLRAVLSRATAGSLLAERDSYAAHVSQADSDASEGLLRNEDHMLDDPSLQDMADEWLWEQGDDD